MLKFISFGSGSSGNCYYLFTENTGLIIDAGIGIRKLKKYFIDYGLSLAHPKNIIITHDHADHVKAVGAISNTYNLPVYTTKAVHDGIKRNFCVRKKINEGNIRIINTGDSFTLDDFHITSFHVPHDSLDNIGFNIDYNGKTICLMTDIGHVTEDMSLAISNADYLIIESNYDTDMLYRGPYPDYLKKRISGGNGHLSNKQCAEALKNYAGKKLRHIWLCHLSQENNHPELARETIEPELMSSDRIDKEHLKLDVLKRTSPCNIFELEI